jgi:hypothetical protein
MQLALSKEVAKVVNVGFLSICLAFFFRLSSGKINRFFLREFICKQLLQVSIPGITKGPMFICSPVLPIKT